MRTLVVLFIKLFPGKLGVKIRKICYARFFGHTSFNIGECVTLGFKIGCLCGGKNLIVSPDTKIFTTTGVLLLGENIFINYGCFISADRSKISIGDNTIIGPGVTIWASNHRYESKDKLILEQGYVSHEVIIGNDVWIGANATILPGAVIEDGCVVAAGAVVTNKRIHSYSIVAGVPARIIGERS